MISLPRVIDASGSNGSAVDTRSRATQLDEIKRRLLDVMLGMLYMDCGAGACGFSAELLWYYHASSSTQHMAMSTTHERLRYMGIPSDRRHAFLLLCSLCWAKPAQRAVTSWVVVTQLQELGILCETGKSLVPVFKLEATSGSTDWEKV